MGRSFRQVSVRILKKVAAHCQWFCFSLPFLGFSNTRLRRDLWPKTVDMYMKMQKYLIKMNKLNKNIVTYHGVFKTDKYCDLELTLVMIKCTCDFV